MTLRPCAFVKCDKLKVSYLHYHNAYGHKTWQYCDLLWAASTHEDTWPYNNVATEDYLIKKNISTFTMPMATKIGRMGTYLERLLFTTTVPMATKLNSIVSNLQEPLPIMLPKLLVVWSCKITWQTKSDNLWNMGSCDELKTYLHFQNGYGQQTH